MKIFNLGDGDQLFCDETIKRLIKKAWPCLSFLAPFMNYECPRGGTHDTFCLTTLQLLKK